MAVPQQMTPQTPISVGLACTSFFAILTPMDIGKRLREIREAKGLSQADIEKRSGLLRSYVSRVEGGYTAPSLATLEKFAKALRWNRTSCSSMSGLPRRNSGLRLSRLPLHHLQGSQRFLGFQSDALIAYLDWSKVSKMASLSKEARISMAREQSSSTRRASPALVIWALPQPECPDH